MTSRLSICTSNYPGYPVRYEYFDDNEQGLAKAKIRLKQIVEEEMATWGKKKLSAFYIPGKIEEKEFISVKRINGDGTQEVLISAENDMIRNWISISDENSH